MHSCKSKLPKFFASSKLLGLSLAEKFPFIRFRAKKTINSRPAKTSLNTKRSKFDEVYIKSQKMIPKIYLYFIYEIKINID